MIKNVTKVKSVKDLHFVHFNAFFAETQYSSFTMVSNGTPSPLCFFQPLHFSERVIFFKRKMVVFLLFWFYRLQLRSCRKVCSAFLPYYIQFALWFLLCPTNWAKKKKHIKCAKCKFQRNCVCKKHCRNDQKQMA